jgi:hypothetical protein
MPAGAGGDLNGSQSPEGCLRYAVSVLNRHFFRASEGFCRHGIFHGFTIVQENKPLNIKDKNCSFTIEWE